MGSPHTISLNGRQYDALSGRLIKESPDEKHPRNLSRGGIDGFISAKSQKVSDIVTPIKHKLSNKNSSHKVAPHSHRAPQHSKTLMRKAVKKPDTSKIKHHANSTRRATYALASSGYRAIAPAKEAVVSHAQAIQQSNFVNKFNELTTPANPIQPDASIPQTTANSTVHLKNLDRLSQIEANPKSEDAIFTEAALKLADSHQPIKRSQIRFYERIADRLKIKVRTLFLVTMVLILIIAGSVMSLLFHNNVKMFIADNRANIHGILPSDQPAGFGISKINYTHAAGNTGSIQITYKSHSDSRSYIINEEASSFDSQGLAQAVVQPVVGSSYQTYQVGGRTVYFFKNNAVWVDGGIYYTLSNNAKLTNDQITQIVNTT